MNFTTNMFAGFAGMLGVAMVIVNVIMAIFVYTDAERLAKTNPQMPKIFPAAVWALACLFTGIPALALYWAAHHSTLAK